MINKYKVFSDVSLYQLETSVNGLIQQGCQPLGGIGITSAKLNADYESDDNGKENLVFVQAMVR